MQGISTHQIPDDKPANINMTLLDHYQRNGKSEESLRKEKRGDLPEPRGAKKHKVVDKRLYTAIQAI
jgi:hypothetical protein